MGIRGVSGGYQGGIKGIPRGQHRGIQGVLGGYQGGFRGVPGGGYYGGIRGVSGGVSGPVHNLLMRYFTLDNSKLEVFENYFFDIVTT